MHLLYYGIALFVAIVGTIVPLLLCKKNKIEGKKKTWMFKIIAYVFAAVFFSRSLIGKLAIAETIGLNIFSPFGAEGLFPAFLSTMVLWLVSAAFVLTVTYPFFKGKIKSLTGLMKFFATPIYVLAIATISPTLIAMVGDKAFTTVHPNGILYAAEIGLGFSLCASVWVESWKTKVNKKAFLKCLSIGIAMFIVAFPFYAPKVLFGLAPSNTTPIDLNIEHRIVLYGAIILPILLTVWFGRFDYDHRRYTLLYMTTAGMISYSYGYTFATFADPASLPLHLCNTAMYIIPICLYFKLDKLFYFTLFINVLGAFFAMAMPNYSETLNYMETEFWNFWVNHYYAFFMPILCISLRMYERPKMRQFLYSLMGFGGYFLLVLVLNAWLSNYQTSPVDFFFINSDFIADKLGTWAENLRNITVSFTIGDATLLFYPVYQVLYFVVYIGLSFAMWFLYEQGFQIADLYNEIVIRNKKLRADQLALAVKLGGKKNMEPIHAENSHKLIIKHFNKKYSTSDVYAVKDMCLEIGPGITGIMGQNGAGKSTTIKSITGIQSITSGSIEVCGYDVEKQSVGAKMQTGFVPDHYALYENLTGREYVNYIADLYGVSKEERTERIEEFVTRFNLHHAFDNPIKTYSHGMKQKITIMSALVHAPKLWILDEPLTGLDPESIVQVKETMKKHAEAGNIVVFSSHLVDVVERVCDSVLIMKKGEVLCHRTIKQLEENGLNLEDYYMEMIDIRPKTEKTLALEEKFPYVPAKFEDDVVEVVEESAQEEAAVAEVESVAEEV